LSHVWSTEPERDSGRPNGAAARPAVRKQRRLPVLAGLLAGVAALLLYGLTGARGVEWQDSGIHQYRILTGQLEHPLGLALSHPLHYWLGRMMLSVPIGAPLWRLNMLSAIGGAVGVGVLTGLVTRLTRSPVAGLLAGAAVGSAHSYWQMSALTETYTLAAALMTIEWALLLRYCRRGHPGWLVAVLGINGLHVADHLLGLMPLATYAALLLTRTLRGRVRSFWLPTAASAWLAGAAPYWLLVLSYYQRTGDLGATLHSALFGGGAGVPGWRGDVLNLRLTWGQLKLAVMSFGYCFPCATSVIALLGIWRRTGRTTKAWRRVLIAQTVLVFAFVARYPIPDLYTYFTPVCVLTALWFGLGAGWLLRRWPTPRWRRRVLILLSLNALAPLLVYSLFPWVAETRGWWRTRMRDLPFRNEYAAFLQPWRAGDESAAQMARTALQQAGPGGWIVADSTTAYAIAVTYLLYGGPPEVRVYWVRRCLTEPVAELTDAELAAHLTAGYAVLAVPAEHIRRQFAAPLNIEEGQPFWRVRLAPR